MLCQPLLPQLTHSIPVGRGPGVIVVSPDGRAIYVANSLDASVSVITREELVPDESGSARDTAQGVTFDELFSSPDQYHGKDILVTSHRVV